MVALVQGNAVLSRGNVVILGILGTLFFFGATIGLKWHKAPYPIGTVVRTCLLFVFSAVVMMTVCIFEWPKSPQEIAEAINQKIEQRQAARANSIPLILEVKPCRSDTLRDCSDEQLYQWGETLNDSVGEILRRYIKAIEEARNTQDREIKNQMFQRASLTLSSDFRDCCAIETLKYLEELKVRVGGYGVGSYSYERVVEWLRGFVKPPLFGTKDIDINDAFVTSVALLHMFILHGRLEQRVKKEHPKE